MRRWRRARPQPRLDQDALLSQLQSALGAASRVAGVLVERSRVDDDPVGRLPGGGERRGCVLSRRWRRISPTIVGIAYAVNEDRAPGRSGRSP